MDLIKEVKNNIDKYKKENLIVAVSGGVDSVVLLDILCKIFNKNNLIVAHFDHALRTSSIDDKNFVNNFAKKYGLKFVSQKAQHLKSKIGNLEEKSRDARYKFLLKVARENYSNYIITAHHADDQLETVLMNLKRGAFIEGLTGMDFRTALSPGLFVLRPMLNITKGAIVNYQKKNNLNFVEDETNKDKTFLRNSMRQNVFKNMNDITKIKLLQRVDDLRRENEKIKRDISVFMKRSVLKKCKGTVFLDKVYVGKLKESIVSEIIKLSITEINGSLNDVYQSNILDATKLVLNKKSGLKLYLPNNIRMILDSNKVVITNSKIKEVKILDQKLRIGLNKIRNQGWTMELSIFNKTDNQKICLDFNKIKFPLRIVPYKEGMKIKLKNIGTKKLQDIFVDKKIERRHRKSFPILIDAKGELLAIIDLAVSESCFPDRKTVKYLLIDIKA